LYEFLAAGILLSRCNLERAINGNRIGCVSNLIPPITKSSKMVYKQVVIIFFKNCQPQAHPSGDESQPSQGNPCWNYRTITYYYQGDGPFSLYGEEVSTTYDHRSRFVKRKLHV